MFYFLFKTIYSIVIIAGKQFLLPFHRQLEVFCCSYCHTYFFQNLLKTCLLIQEVCVDYELHRYS